MKRIFSCILLCVVLCICLNGCTIHSSKAYTFNVDTGDTIKINMNTSEQYDLSSSLPIQFSQNGSTISQGTFAQEESYDYYKSIVDSDDSVELLDEGSKNGVTYFFYKVSGYSGMEYDYVMKINNSKTSFIIGNTISQESAEEVFSRLTFSVE